MRTLTSASFRNVSLMVLVACAAVTTASAQILPKKFWNQLKENGLVYAVPDGYASTPVKENGDVMYDFAIRCTTKKLEIRYVIRPVPRLTRNGNDLSEGMLMTMALNISDGKAVRPEHFPKQSVKEEFGADKGFTVMVPVDSEFGEGYARCMLNVIHKDNVADAFTFYLFDDPRVLIQEMGRLAVFHALTFR